MTTEANCWITNADGVSNFKILEKVKQFFDERAENHSVFESFNDSLTGNCRAILVKNDVTKHEFMLQVSGSAIKCLLNPNTGSANALTFGSLGPSGSLDYVHPSNTGSMSSPQIDAISFGALPGSTLYMAEYEDAFFLGTRYANAEYWYQCLNVGKVYVPSNASDPDVGLDGYGILGGIPCVSHVAGASFWTSTNTATSVIRTGESTWTNPVALTEPKPEQANDLNGSIRLVEVPIKAGSGGPLIGYTKYVRQYKNAGGHLGYIMSNGSDNQAWVRYRFSSNDYHMCMLWNKLSVSVT